METYIKEKHIELTIVPVAGHCLLRDFVVSHILNVFLNSFIYPCYQIKVEMANSIHIPYEIYITNKHMFIEK